MKLNDDKCTAWATDGKSPETHLARTLWENAGDHGGFVVCGFPATCDDPAAEAALAFPIGNPNFVEKFLAKRTMATEVLTKQLSTWRRRQALRPPQAKPLTASYAGASSRKLVTS